ncbi:MAG: DUF1109 domain-containing protein [Rhodocyclaceae bacterium]
MKTGDLVAMLATGAGAVDAGAQTRRLVVALACGTLASALLMAVLLGVRPTLARDAVLPMFWIKAAFCALLAWAGLLAVRRLSRPGTPLGWAPAGLAAPLIVMWALAAAALAGAEPAARAQLFYGQTAASCPLLIAMLSVPLFVALTWVMSELAPTRLRLAGAAVGAASGAIGALVYTLHCPELAAPFLGFWYVLGMVIPALAGLWLGPRLLRW